MFNAYARRVIGWSCVLTTQWVRKPLITKHCIYNQKYHIDFSLEHLLFYIRIPNIDDHFVYNLFRKVLKGNWDFGSLMSDAGSGIMMGSNNVSVTSPGNGDGSNSSNAVINNSEINHLANKPCEQIRYSASSDRISSGNSTLGRSVTRALWAGVKTTEGNHYTITHVQPIEQKRSLTQTFQVDEDSAGYTTLDPGATNDNTIFYCCTDLMVGLPIHDAVPSTPVTSLDDVEPTGQTPHVTYVNMNTIHPGGKRRPYVSSPICTDTNLPALNSRTRNPSTCHIHPPKRLR